MNRSRREMHKLESVAGARFAGLSILATILALSQLACRNEPVTDTDREIFVRVADLTEYGFEMQDPAKYEKFEKSRYFDGSYELTYEFELPDGHEKSLYMQVTASVEKNKSDARVSHGAEKFVFGLGLRAEGIKIEEKPGFFKYGDDSTFYVLTKNERPVGNFFVARDGLKTYSIVIAGFYFDDPATWAEMVRPRLEKFSAYKP